MGNSCCGGGDFPEPRGGDGQERKRYAGGAAPAVNAMTPDEDERREQARKAAEERARQNAVRGTQRYNPKRKPKPVEPYQGDNQGGADISDWT